MAESYEHLQGSETNVDDHPADNITHPEPGPRPSSVAESRMKRGAVLMSPILAAGAAIAGIAMPAYALTQRKD